MRAWQLSLAIFGWVLATSLLLWMMLYHIHSDPPTPYPILNDTPQTTTTTMPPLQTTLVLSNSTETAESSCQTVRWRELLVDERGSVCLSGSNTEEGQCCQKQRPTLVELETDTMMHSKWQCFYHFVYCVSYCIQRYHATLDNCVSQCQSSGRTIDIEPRWVYPHCVHGRPVLRNTPPESSVTPNATKIEWLRLG